MLLAVFIVSNVSAQGNSTLYPPGWNKEAMTPPMGWRSWNAFGPNINNATFVKTIDALVAKVYEIDGTKASLADAGYGRVGIDEGWENCSGSDPNHGLRRHDIDGFPMVRTRLALSLLELRASIKNKCLILQDLTCA